MARCGQLFATWEELKILAENDDEEMIDVEIVDISDSDSSEVESNEEEQRIKHVQVNEPTETAKESMTKDHTLMLSDENKSSDIVHIESRGTISDIPDQQVRIKTEVEPMNVEEITVVPEISTNLNEDISTSKFDKSGTETILPPSSIRQLLLGNTAVANQQKHFDAVIVNHVDTNAVFPNILPVIINAESLSSLAPDSTTDKTPVTFPASDNWGGAYNFQIHVKTDESQKKNGSSIYSNYLQKLYASKDVPFFIRCSGSEVPPGAIIRATGVFKQAEHAFEVVQRCATHIQEDAAKGLVECEHLVQSLSEHAVYEKSPRTGRCSVIIPYEAPQCGAKDSIYVYKLTCYSSCPGGLNRKPILLLFTLEKDGYHLGRQSIEVKVCACPSRDVILDQNRAKSKVNFGDVSLTMSSPKSVLKVAQSEILPKPNTNFSIKVKDEKLYEFLNEMKVLYETAHSALGVSALQKCDDEKTASAVANLLLNS